MTSLTARTSSIATAIAVMVAGGTIDADTFPFRVAFDNVPGAIELESGDVDTGIEILEQQLGDENANTGLVLATLCGAYIIDASLHKAEGICNQAVERYPGGTAFNNRGVLRVFNGDFRGAEADFNRARPERMAEYLEYLKTRDVGLIADGNFSLLEELAARHSTVDVKTSVAANAGADVEPIRD